MWSEEDAEGDGMEWYCESYEFQQNTPTNV